MKIESYQLHVHVPESEQRQQGLIEKIIKEGVVDEEIYE